MNILYAMSTKSDFERKTFCVKIAVDLFVRSWVETRWNQTDSSISWRRPLREVVSWNLILAAEIQMNWSSTSSWGRELKLHKEETDPETYNVDLFVRSWVETYMAMGLYWLYRGRPLREVVSWNIPLVLIQKVSVCRPLREVVSWNSISQLCFYIFVVDLFVRPWVETLRL